MIDPWKDGFSRSRLNDRESEGAVPQDDIGTSGTTFRSLGEIVRPIVARLLAAQFSPHSSVFGLSQAGDAPDGAAQRRQEERHQ